MVEGLFTLAKSTPYNGIWGAILLIFVLSWLASWHMSAHARLDCSEISDSEVKHECERGDFAKMRGLIYDPSSQDLSMKNWIYRGRKVQWEGNPLVSARCTDNGAAPSITINNWDEGDDAYKCSDNTQIAQPLAEFLNYNLKSCVKAGMLAANITGGIKSVAINNIGVMAARRINTGRNGCKGQSLSSRKARNCRISYHSTGRAIDATSFSVVTDDGKTYELPASCTDEKGKLREGFLAGCKRTGDMGAFYDKFGECWEKRVQDQKKGCVGSNSVLCQGLGNTCDGQAGVLNCDHNKLHHNHMHLSLPLCPHPNGISEE